MKYNAEFGSGDVFTTMMNHIDGMSRDVALLEILGPNPNSTIRFLRTQVTKQAKEIDAKNNNSKASSKLQGAFDKFDDMFDYISGKAHTPSNEGGRTFAGLGNLHCGLPGLDIYPGHSDRPELYQDWKAYGWDACLEVLYEKSFAMMTANKLLSSKLSAWASLQRTSLWRMVRPGMLAR